MSSASCPPTCDLQHRSGSAWKTKPQVQGLTNGARELMLLIHSDPAKLWQTPKKGREEPGNCPAISSSMPAIRKSTRPTRGIPISSTAIVPSCRRKTSSSHTSNTPEIGTPNRRLAASRSHHVQPP